MKTTIPIKVDFGAASPINQSKKIVFLRQKINTTNKEKREMQAL